MDVIALITTQRAAQIMLNELASDLQHCAGISNKEKTRLASKCYDIQFILQLARKGGGDSCTR